VAIIKIKHKGLRELWVDGRTRRVGKEHHRNALAIMDYLHRIRDIEDCAGFKGFHALSGDRKGEYTMHVSGNWCVTLTFDGKDVTLLDLEDYH
jgi:toxin HigB-1